jgi:hypothetical protein
MTPYSHQMKRMGHVINRKSKDEHVYRDFRNVIVEWYRQSSRGEIC